MLNYNHIFILLLIGMLFAPYMTVSAYFIIGLLGGG